MTDIDKPSWQIYQEEMAALGYGHALWQPAPTPDYDCVSIGDVGYIHEGQFIRLFSACSPPQEVSDYTGESDPPLQHTSEVPRVRAPCCLHTSTVRKLGRITDPEVDGFSTLPEDRFTFELSGDRGAALVTTHDTRRKDCVDGSVLDKHISNNYRNWTRFAHDTAQLPRDAQLILVSGFDVTRDFSMVSYLHGPRRYPFPIGIPARRQMFFSTWSHFRGGWSYTRQPYFNGGTSHRFNQCVFIRYFTMRHRSFFSQVAQFLRARFGSMGNGGKSVPGPAPKPDDRPTTGDEGNPGGQFYSTTGGADTEKTTAAQTTSYEKDPDDWDVIADYVFRNSDAVSVLLHHHDLAEIRNVGCTDDLSTLLARHKPHIVVDADGVGRITHSAPKGLHHLNVSDRLHNVVRGQECDECLGRIRDTNTPLPTSYVIPPNLPTVDSDPFVQDSSLEGTKLRFFYSNALYPSSRMT